MQLCDINPFVRYAQIQPSIMSAAPLKCAYDYRIFYVLNGSAEFVLSDQIVTVSAGTLIYLRPATPYYFDGEIETIVLNFDITRNYANRKATLPLSKNIELFCSEKVLENDPPEELKKISIIKNAFDIEPNMKECICAFTSSTIYSDAESSAILKKILCYIAQNENSTKKISPLVHEIALYLQQNYGRELKNEQIAREFGYHSFYLNRVFKEATGMTIHQRLIMERVHIAKQLLENTNLNVNLISYEVGFSNHSQFCNTFKKYTGCSPKQYRKRNEYQ